MIYYQDLTCKKLKHTDKCPSWCSGKYLYKYSEATNCKTVSPRNSNLWFDPLRWKGGKKKIQKSKIFKT